MSAGPHIHIAPGASEFLGLDLQTMSRFCEAWLAEHQRIVEHGGPGLLKNAPETAVTVVNPPGLPGVCVKEFKWRGWRHALKGFFRATQGMRAFRNGSLLREAGIGAPRALAMIRKTTLGLAQTEWVLMEAIAGALELDRYLLTRMSAGWSSEEKKRLSLYLAKFIGTMHAQGIYHSDLKTCNILVAPRSTENQEQAVRPANSRRDSAASAEHTTTNDSDPILLLLDYDDVTFSHPLSERRRIKNLAQIFLSTPAAIGAADRLRFMREYARSSGLDRAHARRIARRVLDVAAGRQILYVGFRGDIVEKWD
ncbi:MAG: hypothetical protein FJ118_16245 [Deltaproteobacteria bacterium]|nr:hypothetical protein [Deltaproteobacteria bacterium]